MMNDNLDEPAIVLPGELAVGPWPGPRRLAELARLGVTAVLSLQEPDEAPEPDTTSLGGLRWARVPVADGHLGGSMSLSQLSAAVEHLRRWGEAGEMTYVHCYAGIGRSPTVCAAYLAATRGLPLGQALAQVRGARPRSSPTSQQLLVLAEFIRRLPPA